MIDLDDAGLAAYFDDQKVNRHPEYWRRFGRRPDFEGSVSLDLGSGVGAMAVEMAEEGADVLGIELHQERVEFSNRHVASRYPALAKRVQFRNAALADIELREHFDYVVSKDTFEHVEDLAGMLRFLHDVLKPGGEIWTGFSPMWFSPNGDHGLAGGRLPWVHLLLPRGRVLARMSKKTGREISSLQDVDLNGLSPRQFRRYVDEAGLEIAFIKYNAGDKLGLKVMRGARRLPGLERYFTAGIYAVLRRPI